MLAAAPHLLRTGGALAAHRGADQSTRAMRCCSIPPRVPAPRSLSGLLNRNSDAAASETVVGLLLETARAQLGVALPFETLYAWRQAGLPMSFEITGHKAALEGAFVRTQAHTAADALRFAREWAEQGVTGITIVNPKGESYDIDRFGMIVSTNEEDSDADRT